MCCHLPGCKRDAETRRDRFQSVNRQHTRSLLNIRQQHRHRGVAVPRVHQRTIDLILFCDIDPYLIAQFTAVGKVAGIRSFERDVRRCIALEYLSY